MIRRKGGDTYSGAHTLVRMGSNWFSYKKAREPAKPKAHIKEANLVERLNRSARLAQETAKQLWKDSGPDIVRSYVRRVRRHK